MVHVMMKVRVLYGALLADEKIVVFERAADGSLAVRSEVACPGKPMWLCVNEQQNKMSTGQKSVLDACTLSNELVSFSIDPASGALKEISRIPLPPPTPTDPHGEAWAGPPCACHICRVGENRSSTSGSLLEREFVLTTCYTAGTVSVHGTDPESGAVAGDALDHQQTSHGCHSVNRLPGSDDFYVPCVAAWTGEGHDPNNTVLAGNRIYQYTLNRQSGKLSSVGEPYIPPPAGPVAEPRFGAKHSDASPISRFGTRPEEGPRHAAVHPIFGFFQTWMPKVVYTSNEQGNSVTAYAVQAFQQNELKVVNSVSTVRTAVTLNSQRAARRVSLSGLCAGALYHMAGPCSCARAEAGALTTFLIRQVPEDFAAKSTTSELRVLPNGSHLFCCNRGHDSIATLGIKDEDGGLKPSCITPVSHTPQALELDPMGQFLYTAGNGAAGDAGALTTFSVDAKTGALEKVGELAVGKDPIRMLALDWCVP